jgi:uncharacterized protein YhaN
MRLNRLDLTRYGKFTDLSLTFPLPAPGGPDLHVIYGANEAGKSTLLEGWLDLLFQIPVRSNMGFIHTYQSMQLGAELEIDSRTFEVRRVKKRDNSLLDGNDAPLGEALLHGGLRGLDRESYAAMFSLNRQTLGDGGESILASKGDLGELLFQASAGLNDLAAQLESVRDETEEFLNRTGRKGKLRELGHTFDNLGKHIKELDTAAAEFARLSTQRDQARDAWRQAREDLETAQTKMVETERLILACPLLPRLERLDAQISEFATLPEPPEGWLAELPALDRAEVAVVTQLETARQTVAGLEKELEDLVPDQAILEQREEIAAVEGLKSAHDEAVKDLSRRRGDLLSKTEAMQESLSRLGKQGADPTTLILEARTMGRFRALIERNSSLETARNAASRELQDAKANLERATRRLRDAGGSSSDLGGLDGLVQGIRRDDPVGAYDRAKERADEAEAELKTALVSLAPWSGDAAALAVLTKPDRDTIERLETEIAEADKQAERTQDRLGQLELVFDQIKAKRDSIGATTVVTIEEAAQIRSQRETEWSLHRAALTDETAERFEKVLRLDDQVTATLAQQRAHAEKAADADRDLVEAKRQIEIAKEQLENAKSRCETLSEELAEVITTVSAALPASMDIRTFRAWLDRLDIADKAFAQHGLAVREQSRHQQRFERARADLLTALTQMDYEMPEQTGLTLALETAQSLLDRATQIEALREAEAQSIEDLARREAAMQIAVDARTEWQTDWEATCADTWMAGVSLGVSEMRAILEELDRLREHHRDVADLTHRIDTMRANRDKFEQAVKALANRLDMVADGPIPELWRAVSTRLRVAEGEEAKRGHISKRLATAAQTLTKLEEDARIHQHRTAEFTRHFGVASWAEARDALTRAGELSKLRNARQELAEDLCAQMRSSTVEEAYTKLEGLDVDALQARADRLAVEVEILRSIQEDEQDGFRKAQDAVEAVGGDDAVAQLEEQRQTVLLEMEDGARRYMRQRLGLVAIDAALRSYRDTHRSGMLERASEAFRIMSRNSYSGLAAQPDGTHEILVALATEGGSKQADQLSDGTRAQLYLALRIAGYHEYARNNGPVPFIADDIMESFDDERAAETFGLLSKMSETGQVIYLTHHAHVRDIAMNVCPTVQIHALPA